MYAILCASTEDPLYAEVRTNAGVALKYGQKIEIRGKEREIREIGKTTFFLSAVYEGTKGTSGDVENIAALISLHFASLSLFSLFLSLSLSLCSFSSP